MKSKTNLAEAAMAIALGQSIGNPNMRSAWETDSLIENHSCKIIGSEKTYKKLNVGTIDIAFPLANTNFAGDGISHILNQIMGGQVDIELIESCFVESINIPAIIQRQYFNKPKYGIGGIRAYTGVYEKPILGGILKPKTGVSPKILLEMVKEMVEGGVDFIKEDEILSDPDFCTIEDRLPLVMNYLKDKRTIYAVSITSDPGQVLERAQLVSELGGNAIHINMWSGLGIYKSVRDLDLPLFLFYQKSGEQVITNKNNRYGISWTVLCKLAGLSGVDFIHAGMLGGYMGMDERDLDQAIDVLWSHDVMPSLSCGMHPGLVEATVKRYGDDCMLNVGGAIHGHPGGSYAGALAMRQAIDGTYGEEYDQAISLWGKLDV